MIAVFRGNETLYPVLLSTDYTFELQQPFGDALLSRTPFGVAKGKWNLLVGRSGSGKTTFLRALQGDLPSYTRGAGELPQRRFYMPQNVDVFEPFSTVDNVRAYGGKPQDAFASFEELALARKFWGRKNAIEISGGERQRLIVAQIIAARPDMLLLDEPSKGLDRAGRLVTFNALARHFSGRAEYNAVTVVCADHDFGGIYNMFDYVFEILDGRQTLVWSKSPSR
jgi:ABC-type multidrug transport system ATPase subunit